MMKPPMMLMNRIRMPAMASPRTNLLAPSMEPKKSAFAQLGAAALWPRLVDQAGVQVGIHRHLLAGHGVQGEARADFSNPLGTLVTTMKLITTRMAKTIRPTGEIAADQEVAKARSPDRPRRAGVAPAAPRGGGHVERQAHQVVSSSTTGKAAKSSAAPCWRPPSSPSRPSRC